MDIISHGLWAGASFYRKCKLHYRLAFLFSIFPDAFAFVPYLFLMLLGYEKHSFSARPPIEIFSPVTFILYNISHSLLVFSVVFFGIYLFKKGFFWPMAGWGLHILLDIPTHDIKFFATPFLWPISDFKVDGFSWGQPWFIILNYSALFLVYAWLVIRKRKFAKQNLHEIPEME